MAVPGADTLARAASFPFGDTTLGEFFDNADNSATVAHMSSRRKKDVPHLYAKILLALDELHMVLEASPPTAPTPVRQNPVSGNSCTSLVALKPKSHKTKKDEPKPVHVKLPSERVTTQSQAKQPAFRFFRWPSLHGYGKYLERGLLFLLVFAPNVLVDLGFYWLTLFTDALADHSFAFVVRSISRVFEPVTAGLSSMYDWVASTWIGQSVAKSALLRSENQVSITHSMLLVLLTFVGRHLGQYSP
mmetsp:Transcript_83780/g.131942  ORF Transcript_83780/g.131942 Transcript_83780/m.131942 type:complete len:246 (+) Transcript_83780:10-747(+)